MSTDKNWATEGNKARNEAKELNDGIAKRKGWVVTFEATEVLDDPRVPGGTTGVGYRLLARPKGAPASSAQPFATGEEVEAYLTEFPDVAGAEAFER